MPSPLAADQYHTIKPGDFVTRTRYSHGFRAHRSITVERIVTLHGENKKPSAFYLYDDAQDLLVLFTDPSPAIDEVTVYTPQTDASYNDAIETVVKVLGENPATRGKIDYSDMYNLAAEIVDALED